MMCERGNGPNIAGEATHWINVHICNVWSVKMVPSCCGMHYVNRARHSVFLLEIEKKNASRRLVCHHTVCAETDTEQIKNLFSYLRVHNALNAKAHQLVALCA